MNKKLDLSSFIFNFKDFSQPYSISAFFHPTFFITILLYLGLSKLVLLFFPDITEVMVIWPAIGIAVSILLIKGKRFWPAILIASFLTFFTSGYSFFFSLLIAIISVVEVLFGLNLIKVNFDYSLRTSSDYFKLFFLVGVFSTAIGAFLYSLIFLSFGYIDEIEIFRTFRFIWMGHLIGINIVTPFALIWRQETDNFTRTRLLEIILFFTICFLAGQAIFLDWLNDYVGKINRGYWMYLFVTIGAIRFGRHGASLIISMVAIQGVWGAFIGTGFFSQDIARTGLINYWVYTMVVVVVGMAQATFITERKKEANYDSLTELPNRRLFHDRLEVEIKKAKRDKYKVTIMFIDLDHFKEVNDTLGHHIGDSLLTQATARISACVRESDTVARLGGDEFTIILPEIGDIGPIERIASDILDTVNKPFLLNNDRAYISASIGITIYPTDGSNPSELLMHADQAMYSAKNNGRNKFAYFTDDMQKKANTYMRLATDLQDALAEDQFMVYYQPIIDFKTNEIIKAEALIRWKHPILGLVNPGIFIHIAEERGLIDDIGRWVFKEATSNVKDWSDITGKEFQVGVNVSPVQFMSRTSQMAFIEHLEGQDVAGNHISIEITEGLLLNDQPVVMEKLLEFRNAGINVAIDDFGTGYSSLSYLKKFPIDFLKIDQSFIFELVSDKNNQTLAKAIIVMAHALNLKVIAEGVETAEQRDMLIEFGCDYGQGYHYAKPMPEDEFRQFLINNIRAN